jgi:hypothetical protein
MCSPVISAEPAEQGVRCLDAGRLWGGLPAALDEVPRPDSVEIKVVVADDSNGDALADIAVSVRSAHRRRVHLIDTHGSDLRTRGVVVRLRSAGRSADAVVKWRPRPALRPSRSDLAWWRRDFPHLRTELDALPDAFAWSAAIEHGVHRYDLADVVAGDRSAVSILSREQRRLIRAVAPGVELEQLRPLAPVQVVRSRLEGTHTASHVVVEIWRWPDGAEIVELSTTCGPRRATAAASELAQVLARCGLSPSRCQRLKTDFPSRE